MEPSSATVLVVEDDPIIRDLILVGLAGLCPQLNVITAADGLEALALIEDCQPDLVLLDILLPQLNGLEVMRRLNEQTGKPLRPVIVISALALREVVQQAVAAGAIDFVVKPFDPRLLAAKVMAALAAPGTAEAPASAGWLPT